MLEASLYLRTFSIQVQALPAWRSGLKRGMFPISTDMTTVQQYLGIGQSNQDEEQHHRDPLHVAVPVDLSPCSVDGLL